VENRDFLFSVAAGGLKILDPGGGVLVESLLFQATILLFGRYLDTFR
jgi:hypothetical protein